MHQQADQIQQKKQRGHWSSSQGVGESWKEHGCEACASQVKWKKDSRTLPVKTSVGLEIKRSDADAMISITRRWRVLMLKKWEVKRWWWCATNRKEKNKKQGERGRRWWSRIRWFWWFANDDEMMFMVRVPQQNWTKKSYFSPRGERRQREQRLKMGEKSGLQLTSTAQGYKYRTVLAGTGQLVLL